VAFAAILVDVDDTLVNHSSSARAAMHAISGRGAEWELWQRITEDYARQVADGLLPYGGMHVMRTARFFAALGTPLPAEEARRREALRVRLLRRGEHVFADAVGFLENARAAGLRLAAVTNASGAHQRAKLVTLGLAHYLDAVVVAGELGARKPDPVVFHTACARLGVPPGRTVHIGDRLDTDAVGACRAGLRGVWLDRGAHHAAHGDVGVPVIRTLPEGLDLLAPEPALLAS
jgi:putative hydrolase of the HAD superfamily